MSLPPETDFPFISGLDDLDGKTIAVVQGYVSQEILQKDFPELKLSLVKSVSDGLKQNQPEQGGCVCGESCLHHLLHQANRAEPTSRFRRVTPYKFKLSMGVRKDWPQLVSILDKVIENMTES